MADHTESSSPPHATDKNSFQGPLPVRPNAADPDTLPSTRVGDKSALAQDRPALRQSTRPRRCLCLGGSFNPVHYGHLETTLAAAEKLQFTVSGRPAAGADVLLIPSARPPHKPGDPDLAPPADRLAMCRLAVASDGRYRAIGVSDLELRRDGPSYTILTVRALRAAGYDEVVWLVGADLLAGLPRWSEFDALLAEATLAVMRRPGHPIDWPALPPPVRPLAANVVEVPTLDISATTIRQCLRRGESVEGMTPDAVAEYARSRTLYSGERPPGDRSRAASADRSGPTR